MLDKRPHEKNTFTRIIKLKNSFWPIEKLNAHDILYAPDTVCVLII